MYVVPWPVTFGIAVARSGTMSLPAFPLARLKVTRPSFVADSISQVSVE